MKSQYKFPTTTADCCFSYPCLPSKKPLEKMKLRKKQNIVFHKKKIIFGISNFLKNFMYLLKFPVFRFT